MGPVAAIAEPKISGELEARRVGRETLKLACPLLNLDALDRDQTTGSTAAGLTTINLEFRKERFQRRLRRAISPNSWALGLTLRLKLA